MVRPEGMVLGWGQRRDGEALPAYKNTEYDAVKVGLDWWVRVHSSLECACSKKECLGSGRGGKKANGMYCWITEEEKGV